ncbi:hypothetical protein MEL_321 [Medusavirus stheno T3]|uniref:Uncharacterized protein n=1 Tax=Medusavirus stheno T3 TaxID=3069717 RepID=A0A7S7YEP2_9VIRU|nr:hypothetical protein MEL_321 [Acanthamoeba castellanii medusavirus]QPB44413.1 hypothetical protein MEL_321 [Medusavirus stheno T3]
MPFPDAFRFPLDADEDEIFCPDCDGEIEDMSEGFHCEACMKLYAVCDRCETGEPLAFVAAKLPIKSLDAGDYPNMVRCDVAGICVVGKDERVIATNKEPGLKWAAVGDQRQLSDIASYYWRCHECNETRQTRSD